MTTDYSSPQTGLIIKDTIDSNASLQLSKIVLKDDYRKKWNIHEEDFVCLTKGGQSLRNTLYRVGGFGADIKKDYFMLLKHVEAYYDDSITKDPKRKAHLESQWCILDKNGIEKVNFRFSIHSPYLIKDSCIYSIQNKYYNIETGEQYCEYSSSSMESADYLFLNTKYDKDQSRRGVMKINKLDGTWELFP